MIATALAAACWIVLASPQAIVCGDPLPLLTALAQVRHTLPTQEDGQPSTVAVGSIVLLETVIRARALVATTIPSNARQNGAP